MEKVFKKSYMAKMNSILQMNRLILKYKLFQVFQRKYKYVDSTAAIAYFAITIVMCAGI